MQRHSKESLHLTKQLGELFKEIRKEKYSSIQKFTDEYDIDRSNYSKIERALVDCKFSSFFKISQALGYKPSKLLHLLEEKLGKDFSFIDE